MLAEDVLKRLRAAAASRHVAVSMDPNDISDVLVEIGRLKEQIETLTEKESLEYFPYREEHEQFHELAIIQRNQHRIFDAIRSLQK